MATVGISQKLVDAVKSSILRMRSADMQSRVPTGHTTISSVDASELVNRLIWGEHYSLKDKLPDSWTEDTKTYGFDVHVPDGKGNTPSFRIGFAGLRHAKLRPRLSSYYAMDIMASNVFEDPTLNTLPGVAELKAAVEHCLVASEIGAYWDKVQNDVCGFLQTRRSLNEALKQMPSLSMYIPKEYLDRVAAVTVRATGPSEVKLSEDRIQELTAAAVSARLAGANV